MSQKKNRLTNKHWDGVQCTLKVQHQMPHRNEAMSPTAHDRGHLYSGMTQLHGNPLQDGHSCETGRRCQRTGQVSNLVAKGVRDRQSCRCGHVMPQQSTPPGHVCPPDLSQNYQRRWARGRGRSVRHHDIQSGPWLHASQLWVLLVRLVP